jgi:hypothetical protein
MAKRWLRTNKGTIWGVVLLLVVMQAVPLLADEPEATPTVTPTPITPTPAIVDETPPTATVAAQPELAATLTPTTGLTVQPVITATLAPPASPTPEPTPTAPPTPTVTPTPPSTAHIAVLTSETVLPVGGRKHSEVFIALRDVQPGVRGFELHITFNPAIVRVADVDGEAANGIQIAVTTPFGSTGDGGGQVTVNQADNESGEIVLAFEQPGGLAVGDANEWHKVATITWIAQAEGKSVIAVDGSTRFIATDGGLLRVDATYNGVVFVRAPGKIAGVVHLQGRTNHHGISVSGVLVTARVDKAPTGEEGRFAITTSHGEGFYTLIASMPGYLTAESDSPVKVTMDGIASAGEVTLLGGDVNGDNRVDVRDLSYVAWHFGEYDADADVNGDGVIDISDLTLTASNFGRQGPTTWQVPGQGD